MGDVIEFKLGRKVETFDEAFEKSLAEQIDSQLRKAGVESPGLSTEIATIAVREINVVIEKFQFTINPHVSVNGPLTERCEEKVRFAVRSAAQQCADQVQLHLQDIAMELRLRMAIVACASALSTAKDLKVAV